MKRVLSLLMTLCLLVSLGSVAAEGADKVYALTMGVHKYAVNNTVVDASGVASVTYVRHKDGTTGCANRLYDVGYGETFTLTTAVKEGQEDYYTFVCWLDERGVVIGRETTLDLTIDGSKTAFAAYVETADRHLATYKIVGEGSVCVSSDYEVFQGDGCASLLHGARADFRFTPAKGYAAYYVKIDGEKVSFLANAFGTFSAAVKEKRIKDAFNALLNVMRFFIGGQAVYSVPVVDRDMTFEVGFMKSVFAYKSSILK